MKTSHTILLSLLVAVYSAEDKRFLLDTFFGGHSSGGHLEKYNVDKTQISVSGVSSGAAMATQIHVIYSRHIMGIGMIAGVPYACTGGGGAVTGLTSCMNMPSTISVTYLETLTAGADVLGNIDDTNNMQNDRIWIFDGRNDSKVNPGIGPVIQRYYEHYVNQSSQIKTVFNINAEHGQPTNNYGGACDHFSPSTDYLNNCNFSAAYDLLNFIYGGDLLLLEFDQSDVFYLTTPSMYSMDDTGYIYVPRTCATKTISCKLHVAFHGCGMGRSYINDTYVRHAGYNEVGDLNDIIILYPQVTSSVANPNGCWDWFGYTGVTFAINSGFQPTAIKRMIDKVTG